MESERRTKKHKTGWINSSFGVCDTIENGTSDSDTEIGGIEEFSKPRPSANVHVTNPLKSGTTSLGIGGIPLNRDDLAVHKKKVDEVDAWFLQAYSTPRPVNSTQPMMLLMTGPTGAGKTATLKILASSKQIQIIEWINPMDENVESDWRHQGPSQASKFEDFLISSARYNSLICSSHSKKLILVEDYPNSLLLNPELFHNIIRKYQYMGKSPLVFITTEVHSGQNISYSLFPPNIINELNIQSITFNPVPFTSLMKALSNITKHEGLSDVSSEMQSAICHSCNGDIRNAVLALQYLAQDKYSSKMKEPVVSKTRKRKAQNVKGKTSSRDNNTGLKGKDCLTGIMHSVGRVLHAKREVNVVKGGGSDQDKRGYLKSDPQEIVNQFLSQCCHFVSIVHENYHSIFSDIHSVARATESICGADVLMSDWTERDLLKEVGFSIALRGVMNACNNPVQRWNPLQKPKWKEVMLKTDQYLRNMRYSSSKMSFCDRALCMDLALFHDSNSSKPYVQLETVDSAPVSPIPHITDDDSD